MTKLQIALAIWAFCAAMAYLFVRGACQRKVEGE